MPRVLGRKVVDSEVADFRESLIQSAARPVISVDRIPESLISDLSQQNSIQTRRLIAEKIASGPRPQAQQLGMIFRHLEQETAPEVLREYFSLIKKLGPDIPAARNALRFCYCEDPRLTAEALALSFAPRWWGRQPDFAGIALGLVEALAGIENPAVTHLLLDRLKSFGDYKRFGIPTYCSLLTHPDETIVFKACDLLGDCGQAARGALGALLVLAEDEEGEDKQLFEQAIAKISSAAAAELIAESDVLIRTLTDPADLPPLDEQKPSAELSGEAQEALDLLPEDEESAGSSDSGIMERYLPPGQEAPTNVSAKSQPAVLLEELENFLENCGDAEAVAKKLEVVLLASLRSWDPKLQHDLAVIVANSANREFIQRCFPTVVYSLYDGEDDAVDLLHLRLGALEPISGREMLYLRDPLRVIAARYPASKVSVHIAGLVGIFCPTTGIKFFPDIEQHLRLGDEYDRVSARDALNRILHFSGRDLQTADRAFKLIVSCYDDIDRSPEFRAALIALLPKAPAKFKDTLGFYQRVLSERSERARPARLAVAQGLCLSYWSPNSYVRVEARKLLEVLRHDPELGPFVRKQLRFFSNPEAVYQRLAAGLEGESMMDPGEIGLVVDDLIERVLPKNPAHLAQYRYLFEFARERVISEMLDDPQAPRYRRVLSRALARLSTFSETNA